MGKPVDISGRKFGKLIAIKPTKKKKGSYIVWECKCDCGNTHYATAKDLLSGNTKSCGCSKTKGKDITNQKFGELTAKYRVGKGKHGYIWHCECSCGKTKDVMTKDLTSGKVRSCGHLNLIPRPQPDAINGTRASALNSTKFKNNTSGIRGVSWSKRDGKWEAYIKFKGKHYHLGLFTDIEKAAEVRKLAEDRLFGEFLEWYNELKKKNKKQ